MKEPVRIFVEHGYYGCDTGCCGLRVMVQDEDERWDESIFDFEHYDEDEGHLDERIREEWPEWDALPIVRGDMKCFNR